MSSPQLNLARKWRSKHFDEVVGQDLTIKMLKNSLYLNQFFPVYLFAGQKGCGKTSTARIFAAALNCEKLSEFQLNPRHIDMPCLLCSSCVAMQQGKHPDFMEIDAASNTGVDNVRAIIDAAALLPLMGRKKIYLIDEAHMLSKAAFNAFLKLMEEPPISVVFMLATTDTQKIIETVRSRCFQLFFKPVEQNILVEHLSMICRQEEITHEATGILRIVQETGGSVRDALNLLEQVRFSHPVITDSAVTRVLGYLDDIQLIELYTYAVERRPQELIRRIQELCWEQFVAEYIWKRFILLVRAIIWIKSGVTPQFFNDQLAMMQALAATHSWRMLQDISKLFFEQETIFQKTSAQHAFLEMLLLCIARTPGEKDSLERIIISKENFALHPAADASAVVSDRAEVKKNGEVALKSTSQMWQAFLADLSQLQDPLVNSILLQGSYTSFDQETGVVRVEFSKEHAFFGDLLESAQQSWQPLLKKHFAAHAVLTPEFSGTGDRTGLVSSSAEQDKKKIDNAKCITPSYGQPMQETKNKIIYTKNSLDTSDAQKWEKTHMLLRYFPGIVREMHES